MNTIIASVISGAVAIIVCMIEHAKTVAVLTVKIETLTEQVHKHNNLIERVYRLEEKTALLEQGQKVTDHRILDLEEESKK